MSTFSKRVILVITIFVIIVGIFLLVFNKKEKIEIVPEVPVEVLKQEEIIGSSVEGRTIKAYVYGNGPKEIIFVGGIHGGYEWNTVLLAHRFIDYFDDDLTRIPDNVTVTIIPSLNPDGLYKITKTEGIFDPNKTPSVEETAPGRFNANEVDLNRNFDCKWKPESTWRGNPVSAGSAAFSEPEAKTLRDIVLKKKPEAVVFWHSQGNSVYASECEEGILPETLSIMNTYAKASGYKAVETFDAYPVTGDAEGWLASIGIPAITVELETHETLEWDRNLLGVKALLEYYGRGL